VDAAEFYDALSQVVPRLHPSVRAEQTKLPTTRAYVTTDASREARALLVRASEVQGRPVVLYVDAPAAAGTDLLDLARVTLQP